MRDRSASLLARPEHVTTPPEFFAPERSLEATSFDEALAACEASFRYSREEIAVAQISLEADLALRFHGARYGLTEKAFDDLCKLFHVPVQFAKEVIPVDLAATIVERLKTLHQQTLIVISREDTVVGVLDPAKWMHSRAKVRRPYYRPVQNREVLQLLEKLRSARDDQLRITLADSGLSVELLHATRTLEPQVGDVTRIGLVVTSSETGGSAPQARGYTLRLACTNGATVPAQLGLLRFDTDWRVNFDLRLAAFEASLREFTIDLSLLETAYVHLVEEPITDQLFYNLYRAARYIYRHAPGGERLSDAALGVQPDQRQQLIGQVRQRQAALRSSRPTIAEPPQPTSLRGWDVFNHITGTAREEPYRRRVALEGLAGDVLLAFTPSVN